MNRRNLLIASAASVAGGLIPAAVFAGELSSDAVLDGWLSRWLAAFNASDLAVYRAFVLRHAPSVVPYVNDDLGVREASGGFDLLRSAVTGPGEITAWVKDRAWDRVSRVILTAETPERLADIAFAGAAPSEGVPVGRMSETDALTAFRHRLAQRAAAGGFSGAVLVARNGHVLLSGAYGLADVAGRRPATTATRFCIGSMGKMFTAVAVLQLVEQGRLKLTDTLGAHLAGYPNAAVAAVTVEQLLTHTGGTGDIFGPQYEALAADRRTPADLVRLYGDRAPVFEPGSRWGYSNYGFVLLGVIVEQVSGKPYDRYLQDHVFGPAGMVSTSQAFASDRPTALPYSGASSTGLKPLTPYEGLPAGGGYSTVDDLHAFAVALQDGRLVGAASLALLTTPKVIAGNARWSLGLGLRQRNGATCFGHGGAAPGVNGDFAVYHASGYVTVVLCNRGHPFAANAAEFIGARLPAF